MDRETLSRVAGELGCRVGDFPILYLGLKVGIGLMGVAAWSQVLERVKERLRRWDARSISMGGRATLVKSVLSSLPLYTMSLLEMPKQVEKAFKSMQCKFFWRETEMEKRVVWVKWEEVCKSRLKGGLGVKDLKTFNRALISKLEVPK